MSRYMYYLQTQAPAGNWTDWMGTESKEACIEHALYVEERFETNVRVVERVDTVVWQS